MNKIPKNDEPRISKQFSAFCCRILKNEAINIERVYNRKNSERFFNDLDRQELLSLSTYDTYFKSECTFNVDGILINVSDKKLSDAIKQLEPITRNIILLSYFADMTDKEIAKTLNLGFWFVFRKRSITLERLKNLIQR